MADSLLKWGGHRTDPVNGLILHAFAGAAGWPAMTRRARRYRILTWGFFGATLAAAVLSGAIWASGWSTLLAIAQTATLLAAAGAITCLIVMRRGAKVRHQVDFGVGIGGYRLKDLQDDRRNA